MQKEQIISKLKECGLVAVVRAKDADDALKIADACIKGGVAGIELTYTVPGVSAIIRRLADEYCGSESFLIGAGTVLDSETARDAILNGAQYIVSPAFDEATVRLCNRYRVPVMPGVMSVREVIMALEMGADILKIFPGELFGPKVIQAFHGPIPQAQFMPTGGVTVDNVGEWIQAGAVAVGAGGSLTGSAKTGDYAAITETAKRFITAIRKARGL